MPPTLTDWCVLELVGRASPSTVHLAGIVSGHPRLIDLHQIITSPLQVIAADQTWARTLSRFYFLRIPLQPAAAEDYLIAEAPKIAAICKVKVWQVRLAKAGSMLQHASEQA